MSTEKLSTNASRIIKYAFAAEIAFNSIGGAVLIASPATALASLARDPTFITPTTTFLTQLTGGLVFSFAAPLVRGLRAGATPADRKSAYWFLSAQEIVLVPVLLGKYLNGTDAGVGQRKELLAMALNLLLPLSWRLWCLGWRPQWFGRERDEISLG